MEVRQYMLTSEQQAAQDELAKFLFNDEPEIALTGSPGTGKTYLLQDFMKNVRDIASNLRALGLTTKYNNIVIAATTNKASSLLKRATTIHSVLHLKPEANNKTGETHLIASAPISHRDTIFVVDEASMISSELYSYIQQAISLGNKFIYVGDMNQLPPVNDNFNLFDLPFKKIQLTQLISFKNADLRDLIINIRDTLGDLSKVIDIFKNLTDSQSIHVIKDNNQVEPVLRSFTTDDKCIVYTNANVNRINSFIRSMYRKPKEIVAGDLVVSKSSVQGGVNNKRVFCEESLVVDRITRHTSSLYAITFRDVNDTFFGFNDVFKYQEECKRLFAECKKKKNFKDYNTFINTVLNLKFAYASTVHSSQGSTYSKVFIDLTDIFKCRDPETLAKLLYVAVSRARDEVYIYYGN